METLMDELKAKIIATLSLERVKPSDIKGDDPLFGTGLGLDSIDALELVAMLEQEYGILIEERGVADKAFASVRALADFVSTNRQQCP
jgi:acyl carrier protein